MNEKSNYFLTVRGLGQHHTVEISQVRFQEIEAASNNLEHVLNIEEQWSAVVQNYFDFEAGLLESAAKFMIMPNQDMNSFHDLQLYFSVRLANLLSTCRAYIDQTKKHLTSLHPPDSDISAFKEACSYEYDNRFGFRFMEAMRNYSQHCSLPLHGSSYGVKRQEPNSLEYFVATEIDLEQLRGDKSFKQSILSETNEKKIATEPLVREYLAGLSIAHLKLRKLLKQRLETWVEVIRAAIAEHTDSSPEGIKAPSLQAIRISAANECTQAVHLAEGLLDRIETLQRRHGSLENVPNSFVSGAPRPRKVQR